MVEHGGRVLPEPQPVLEVQGEDGLHPVVGEPLAELVAHDEPDGRRVRPVAGEERELHIREEFMGKERLMKMEKVGHLPP